MAARKWPRSWSAIIETLRWVREVMDERLFCRENQRQPLHSGREREATLHRISLKKAPELGLEYRAERISPGGAPTRGTERLPVCRKQAPAQGCSSRSAPAISPHSLPRRLGLMSPA